MTLTVNIINTPSLQTLYKKKKSSFIQDTVLKISNNSMQPSRASSRIIKEQEKVEPIF